MSDYYCICFIYNRFYILAQCRYYLIYIGTEAYAKPAECGSEMEVSPPPYHVPTRFCRHMGPDEKSPACGICKLVCFI